MTWPQPDLLPHGPAFRLVQSVDALRGDRITCSCRVPDGFPWGASGLIPGYLALEGVAQAAGLLAAQRAGQEAAHGEDAAGTAHGYVARIRTARFLESHLDASQPWVVDSELEGQSGHMVLCRGEARQGNLLLLSVGLALYI